jgi:ATP-dependent DNA helicase RecG
VISACKKHGAKPPIFEEEAGFVYVTFKAPIVATAETTERLGSELESRLESELESLESRVLAALRENPMGKGPLARILGQKQASGPLHQAIRVLLAKGLIERTIPDKPRSRLQRYRTTAAGLAALDQVGPRSGPSRTAQALP